MSHPLRVALNRRLLKAVMVEQGWLNLTTDVQ
jgi:hypothetical protein